LADAALAAVRIAVAEDWPEHALRIRIKACPVTVVPRDEFNLACAAAAANDRVGDPMPAGDAATEAATVNWEKEAVERLRAAGDDPGLRPRILNDPWLSRLDSDEFQALKDLWAVPAAAYVAAQDPSY